MNTAEFLLASGGDEATVLADGPHTYTYGELRASTAAFAEHLLELGLPAGSSVALLAPNGYFWIAAYLATLALGLVVVPMTPTITAEDLRGRMRLAGTRAAFLGRAQERIFGPQLPDGVAVLGESLLEGRSVGRAQIPFSEVGMDADAAYLFTSGTTGSPRAVRLTHRNIQANTTSILDYLMLRADDRVLVVLPFSYVFGASLLHTHLRIGAAMVNHPAFVYPESVVDRLEDERCTGFAGVPSVFHLLMRNSTFPRRPLRSLRTIQQAGGRMSPAIVRELVAAQPQARLFVMYGATEATARLSYLPPDEVLQRPGSIGRGIPGVSLRVVGGDGRQVAPGEVGEIWASGENISPGYLNDDATSAAKMPDGVLHTGDLATVDEEGFISIVDRTEDFIKSWGHRIASQDIESAVMELSDVVAVAVVGVPDEVAGESIGAVVVKRSDSELSADDVIIHCRARLSKHMVPDAVHFVSSLPVNENGKVAKRAVRDLLREAVTARAT